MNRLQAQRIIKRKREREERRKQRFKKKKEEELWKRHPSEDVAYVKQSSTDGASLYAWR